MNYKLLISSGILLVLTIYLFKYLKNEQRLENKSPNPYQSTMIDLWVLFVAMALSSIILFLKGVFDL